MKLHYIEITWKDKKQSCRKLWKYLYPHLSDGHVYYSTCTCRVMSKRIGVQVYVIWTIATVSNSSHMDLHKQVLVDVLWLVRVVGQVCLGLVHAIDLHVEHVLISKVLEANVLEEGPFCADLSKVLIQILASQSNFSFLHKLKSLNKKGQETNTEPSMGQIHLDLPFPSSRIAFARQS